MEHCLEGLLGVLSETHSAGVEFQNMTDGNFTKMEGWCCQADL